MIAAYPRIQHRFDALKALVPPSDGVPDHFRELVDRALADAVKACHYENVRDVQGDVKHQGDAQALFDMFRAYKTPEDLREVFVFHPRLANKRSIWSYVTT